MNPDYSSILFTYPTLSHPFRQVDSQGLPELTLFTKDPCPLCDTLKLELAPFMHRVQLKQVDIEMAENVRFKELYQYDIPVVFLEGQYLCKNRLDVATLERRLCALEH
jgi:acetyl-CoA C-acetyltransferase